MCRSFVDQLVEIQVIWLFDSLLFQRWSARKQALQQVRKHRLKSLSAPIFCLSILTRIQKKKADAPFCDAPAFLALICTVRDEPET